jgi:hypothetical protein
MSHSKFVDRKTLVSIAVAMATAALAGTAGANDARTSIPADMAAAMQRDLNLTAEQLPRFFKLQHETLAREAQARRAFGANFAGGWLERTSTGDFRYVVATAGAAKASLPGSEVRQVRHSLRQLEGTMARLNDIRQRARDARALNGVQSWYVDVQTNSVVVKVQDGAMLRAIDFVAVSAANVDTVRFERAEGVAMPAANVIGGNRYNSCSIGFAVTRGTTKGFATAGHCGRTGSSVSIGGVVVGSVQSSTFPGSDRAWANVRSSDVLYGQVNRYNGTNVAVRGSTEYGVGTAVCRSGYASGWRCGRITALNVTVNYSVGAVYGLRQSSACVTQGDSGGSWMSGNQAQGVSSGGQLNGASPGSNCSFTNPVTYYQRINPLLSAYGLSLVLG